MFAVANTSALRVAAKAPVKARRTVAPKAALVADLKKAAKKAAPAILTATTTMLPAAAALAEEEVTPVDLKLAIGFTVAIGIAVGKNGLFYINHCVGTGVAVAGIQIGDRGVSGADGDVIAKH